MTPSSCLTAQLSNLIYTLIARHSSSSRKLEP